MVQFNCRKQVLVGEAGSLRVSDKDEVTRKLTMLIEGECERYFQLRAAFLEQGATALADKPRGPKRNYRRTSEVVRQVIRHRFLDADASAQVIGQKLRQAGWVVSTRSVERVIADYGLQKKTLQVSPSRRRHP
jgi:hypothetical protein